MHSLNYKNRFICRHNKTLGISCIFYICLIYGLYALWTHLYFGCKTSYAFREKKTNAANFIIKGKAHKYVFEVINCLFCTYRLMFKFWLHNNGSVLVALLKILCMYWSSSRDSFGVQMFTIKLQIKNKIW